jgi:hypothetical protein
MKIMTCAFRSGCETEGTTGFSPWDGGMIDGYGRTDGSQICLCGGPPPWGRSGVARLSRRPAQRPLLRAHVHRLRRGERG